MLRKYSGIFLFILLLSGLLFNACGNKDESLNKKDDGDKKSGDLNSDLLIKDGSGTKVRLLLRPKKGEIFKYKMNAKTTSKENSPLTGDKEISSIQDINYFYSEEVNDVSAAGIITYKIKFDSINIISTISSKDSSMNMVYNSNIKDSVFSKPDFIQYNSIMGEEFFGRVSAQGEISDIYGLEKVYANMYKALGGDTLSNEQKETLRASFGNDAIKAVIQQQFQMFPEKEIYKDSTWTRSYETQILIFPVKNILNYRLKEIKEDNNQVLLSIDADLAVDFIEKEVKDKKMTYMIENSKTGGKGVILYSLSKGCVVNKETNTNIDMNM
ncbi:MAG: DUF6263 family protein, partial [bacterium]